MKLNRHIPPLIAKKALGKPLSEEEESTLQQWLKEEGNQRIFDEIVTMELAGHILQLQHDDYGRRMADRFAGTLQRERRKRMFRKMVLYAGSAAAVLLVCVFASRLFFQEPDVPETLCQEKAIRIIPGETKATLTLTDGQEIAICEENRQEVNRLVDSVRTRNNKVQQAHRRPTYSKLTIPKGGNYQCQLADGTKVWLNSESELRFPDTFEGNERRVFLKGEAFFEVHEDKQHPFIVSTHRGDICVYGTRFNITNYAEETLRTVLVEGKVGFRTTQGKETTLQPSQMLTYDEATDKVDVRYVDITPYTAWVDNHFVFNGQTLQEIMNTLSRWYNFNAVFVDDRLRHIRLSGRLYRNDDIRILLRSYEQTAGIKFHIKDDNIIITP